MSSARAALTAGEKLTNDQPKEAPASSTNAATGPGLREQKEQRRAEAEAREQILAYQVGSTAATGRVLAAPPVLA